MNSINRVVSIPPARRQEEVRLRSLWNVARRHPLLSLGVPALVLAATVLFLITTVPVYEVATSIRVDERKSNIAVLDALETLRSGSQINTEMEVLRSRTLAEVVVDSLGLQVVVSKPRRSPRSSMLSLLEVTRSAPAARYRLRGRADGRFEVQGEFREEGGFLARKRVVAYGDVGVGEPITLDGLRLALAPAAARHELLELSVASFPSAVKRLQRTLSVARPNREADIIVVRYQGTDPELVRDVANATARHFIGQRQRVQKAEARSTVDFLNDQIAALTQQLTTSEEALRSFREGEAVVSLEAEATAQVKRLAEMQAQRDMVEAERAALVKLVREVEGSSPAARGVEASPYRRLMAFPTLLRNAAASELLRLLAEVENARASLLNRRTLQDPDVQVLTVRIHELEDQLRSIATTYLSGLTSQVASLNEALMAFRDELAGIPAKEIALARLQRQGKVLGEVYALLQTRLKEAEIMAAVEDLSVRVVDPAISPLRPIKPRKPLSLALGLLFGLALGLGMAFGREYLDTSVHTREDLQLATGLTVLGLIPRIREAASPNGRGWRMPGAPARDGTSIEPRLVTHRDPRGAVSEAYRNLRTNITFSSPERALKTLVFTSAMPGDGKSTTATNLAITLAQQGARILLVDADLRRGSLHEVFGKLREPGLSEVLLGREPVEAAVQGIDVGDSGVIDLLSTGVLPPNPAELLGSPRMHRLLEQLQGSYDTVILDAPPLNVVTDAAVLGTNSDGVLLVARAGVTDRDALAYAIEQLGNVRAPVLGAVLNDVDHKRQVHYGSRASYAYYYAGKKIG